MSRTMFAAYEMDERGFGALMFPVYFSTPAQLFKAIGTDDGIAAIEVPADCAPRYVRTCDEELNEIPVEFLNRLPA